MYFVNDVFFFFIFLQQYFFSKKATQFLVNIIKDLGFKNVLCVGTPRCVKSKLTIF